MTTTRHIYKTDLYTNDTAHGSPCLPVRVVYDYEPGEPETGVGQWDPDKYDPGSPEEIDVREIWLEPEGAEPCPVTKDGALWNWIVCDLSASLLDEARISNLVKREYA